MCSCLDQLVGVLVLLLQFHFLSSQLGLKVIHLSQDEDQRAKGQVLIDLDSSNFSLWTVGGELSALSGESAPLLYVLSNVRL